MVLLGFGFRGRDVRDFDRCLDFVVRRGGGSEVDGVVVLRGNNVLEVESCWVLRCNLGFCFRDVFKNFWWVNDEGNIFVFWIGIVWLDVDLCNDLFKGCFGDEFGWLFGKVL